MRDKGHSPVLSDISKLKEDISLLWERIQKHFGGGLSIVQTAPVRRKSFILSLIPVAPLSRTGVLSLTGPADPDVPIRDPSYEPSTTKVCAST